MLFRNGSHVGSGNEETKVLLRKMEDFNLFVCVCVCVNVCVCVRPTSEALKLWLPHAQLTFCSSCRCFEKRREARTWCVMAGPHKPLPLHELRCLYRTAGSIVNVKRLCDLVKHPHGAMCILHDKCQIMIVYFCLSLLSCHVTTSIMYKRTMVI